MTYTIDGRPVGGNNAVFVIAEAGVNHNGELSLAEQLVDAAAAAGADAVKFQTFRTGALVTRTAARADYQTVNTGESGSQYQMLQSLELGPEAHFRLKEQAEARGLVFLSTPFDRESLDFLVHTLGLSALKLGSGEVTNLPLISAAGASGLPTVLSTGMSTAAEVIEAVRAFRLAGGQELALLQCVTSYPADPADANLRAMQTLATLTELPIGYSDHCLGNAVALAAAALGACIVEKHFTLDRNLPGPDHVASATPEELAQLVRDIKVVQAALGNGVKEPSAAERENMPVARKSLVTTCDLPAGTVLTDRLLTAKRPGTGISPARLDGVLGRKLRRSVPADTVLAWQDLDDGGPHGS